MPETRREFNSPLADEDFPHRTVATRGPVETQFGHRLVTNDDGPVITDTDARLGENPVTSEKPNGAGPDSTRKQHSIGLRIRRLGVRIPPSARENPEGTAFEPRTVDSDRVGPAAFFHLLNAGKESVVNLGDERGRAALDQLLSAADVVVEGSRPRALEQLGLDVHRHLAARATRVWVSITGHGRTGRGRNRVAFGDDDAARLTRLNPGHLRALYGELLA